jgi:DNA end-binding protein Ku
MPHAIWSGAISFGLVNIPVKIYSATQESSLDLDMLDPHDMSNIKFKRVNENTGKEVPYNKIVKGYKYHDKYVVLEKEDFQRADAEKTKTINIENFVSEDEIDSIYFEQPYYLAPDKSGAKAYALLRDALKHSKKVGLTTFVMRNKEILALLKPRGKAIVLNRIRFEEEIRPLEGLTLPEASTAKSKEMTMATKLVDQLTEKFDISKFRDTYTDRLMDVIKAKAKGVKRPAAKMKVVHRKTEDLLATLQASLKEKRKAAP